MLSSLNIRAEHHNSCEDSLFVKETEKHIYGCISDGCSTGVKSHFASQLICYSFAHYTSVRKEDCTQNRAIYCISQDLLEVKDVVGLDHMNLLATLIVFYYNKETKQLKIRVFGDGYYWVDNVEFIVDQNNTPDYLGYHVEEGLTEFGKYLDKYPVQVYDNVKSFVITSDGIKSITRSSWLADPQTDPNVLLFKVPASENYLNRMWNLIKRDKWTLSDDLSIISYGS